MVRNVLLDDKIVGKVHITKEGLYYAISCRCSIDGEVPYTVSVRCGDKTLNLGLCVPMEGGFGFHTKIPIKKIGEGEMSFSIIPKESLDRFIPISADQPFPGLEMLRTARFHRRGELIGVLIKPQ